MRRPAIFAVIAFALASAAASSSVVAGSPGPELAYSCGDLVLIGRIRDQTFTPIEDARDLIGHGRIDMVIDVKRTLRGKSSKPSLLAAATAHTFVREDRDFLFVVRSASDGRYQVRQLWPSERLPRLAERCS